MPAMVMFEGKSPESAAWVRVGEAVARMRRRRMRVACVPKIIMRVQIG